MAGEVPAETPLQDPLTSASVERLACLSRHWTWADEARTRFEQELAGGWEDDEDPVADRPFGSFYHWCALLCGLSDAALEGRLLSASELDEVRPDLEASQAALRTCRELLVVIPASLEEHPPIVEFLRNEEKLHRLRHLHRVFGDAIREEHLSRELDLLDA